MIVTINYRLGAFGFLDLAGASQGRLSGTGVEGLADPFAGIGGDAKHLDAGSGHRTIGDCATGEACDQSR